MQCLAVSTLSGTEENECLGFKAKFGVFITQDFEGGWRSGLASVQSVGISHHGLQASTYATAMPILSTTVSSISPRGH